MNTSALIYSDDQAAAFDDVAEMFNVFEAASFDIFWVVQIFIAEVYFVAGDFPIA